jgi:hypothetical protein
MIEILKASDSPTSKENEFDKTDGKNWMRNVVLYLAPLATMYLVTVVAAIQTDGLPKLSYFVPSPILQGAMILYVLNTALDFIRKYANGK